MKFYEDILNGFKVRERIRFCDGQTDGRPWQNNVSPSGDIFSSETTGPTEAKNLKSEMLSLARTSKYVDNTSALSINKTEENS